MKKTFILEIDNPSDKIGVFRGLTLHKAWNIDDNPNAHPCAKLRRLMYNMWGCMPGSGLCACLRNRKKLGGSRQFYPHARGETRSLNRSSPSLAHRVISPAQPFMPVFASIGCGAFFDGVTNGHFLYLPITPYIALSRFLVIRKKLSLRSADKLINSKNNMFWLCQRVLSITH